MSNLPDPVLKLLHETLLTHNVTATASFLTALEETGWSEPLLYRVFLTLQRQLGGKVIGLLQRALPLTTQLRRVRKVLKLLSKQLEDLSDSKLYC
ncbi:hypothetical protein NDA01_19750 [Trichocoleus desertorum AS-A10]|uniref:hypothetical protein n=1 Tax=Trichocoleus desertorum TaxID=1481672 RepID=UPI003296A053